MFGIDEWIASQGQGWAFVFVFAALLGLRHATDPDHLTALMTLRLKESEQSPHLIGLCWGLGHAATMVAVGIPTIYLASYLPESVQSGLEMAVGVMIIFMAVRAFLHIYSHSHQHFHHTGALHTHRHRGDHAHRTPISAFLVGLLHGAGGSAGAVALVLSSLDDRRLACIALMVIATFAGASMMICSWLMCRGIDRLGAITQSRWVAITGSVLAFLFGTWYCAAAGLGIWYPF